MARSVPNLRNSGRHPLWQPTRKTLSPLPYSSDKTRPDGTRQDNVVSCLMRSNQFSVEPVWITIVPFRDTIKLMQTDKINYHLSLFETCEVLSKSQRTITRYVRRGLLNPKIVSSNRGTTEYRFAENDVQALKARLVSHQTGQHPSRQDSLGPDKTRQLGTAQV